MGEKVAEKDVSERLNGLRGWVLDKNTIVKQYRFPGFRRAVKFVNMVADTAEELNHHPAIAINYNRVTLSLTTHSRGGLTEDDFRAAALFDGLLEEETPPES